MSGLLINPEPLLLAHTARSDSPPPLPSASQDTLRDELFSLVRRINDPEHPHTLEELGVVDKAHIWFRRPGRRQNEQGGQLGRETPRHSAGDIAETPLHAGAAAHAEDEDEDEDEDEAVIELTPTVPHCSLATTIGLCIRHKVESAIPNIKLAVRIRDGTHRTAMESQNASSPASPTLLLCCALGPSHCAQYFCLCCYHNCALAFFQSVSS